MVRGIADLSRQPAYGDGWGFEPEFETLFESIEELGDYYDRTRADFGERRMRRLLERQGWTVRSATSHVSRSHGPDAIAFKYTRQGPLLWIVDNKAEHSTDRVNEAGALTAPSLALNLPRFIRDLGRPTTERKQALVQLLRRTLDAARRAMALAIAQGTPPAQARITLPAGVGLLVTNAGGRARGISKALGNRLGIQFCDLERGSRCPMPRPLLERTRSVAV